MKYRSVGLSHVSIYRCVSASTMRGAAMASLQPGAEGSQRCSDTRIETGAEFVAALVVGFAGSGLETFRLGWAS